MNVELNEQDYNKAKALADETKTTIEAVISKAVNKFSSSSEIYPVFDILDQYLKSGAVIRFNREGFQLVDPKSGEIIVRGSNFRGMMVNLAMLR